MIAFVDTNVLVRHLTDDPPDQARRATSILEKAERLILTDVVVAELVYVLESYYRYPGKQIALSIRSLLALPSIAIADHDLILRAIELYELQRLDFAEAYIAAAAELTGIAAVASFDRALDRVDAIERIQEI